MSFQVLATPVSIQSAEKDSNRRSANYCPSVWGDQFLSYTGDKKETERDHIKHLELKEEIKKMLMADINNLSKMTLDLIDAIQRLGVSYHFESEVDEILEKIHKVYNDSVPRDEENDDLYYVSLQFRLLRQHGYKISCDVFNKFKDGDRNFKVSLVGDVRGLLSLYEAAHLRVHGENILDEAVAFTTSHLESIATQFSTPYPVQIKHALKRPIRKGLQRLEARYYMSIYQEDASHQKMLLTFAKLDFNKLQKLHLEELRDTARWWKELDFTNKLPFARDRVVECYFWTLGVYFEPEHFWARRILTKVIAMTSVIDDIYDVYGTIEELELFTAAIESESEKDLARQGKLYRLHYAKEAMKTLVKNYFVEAKWCNKKYVPTMDEHLTVALVTCGYSMLATTSFVGMGDIVTREAFEWLFSNPKMVTAASVINRLMDDIVGHKAEQNREHVASSVECFMKEYGATEEEACHELQKQVTNAWKDINEECLRPTSVAMPLLTRILNLARVMDVLYKDEDGYTNAGDELKGFVASLLINPVPL